MALPRSQCIALNSGQETEVVQPMMPTKNVMTISQRLESVVKVIAGLLMFTLVLITFVDVIGRKFGHPLAFAFEFTQVSVALMFYVTLPLVALRGENIFVDLWPLPKSKRRAAFARMCIHLVCAIIVSFGALQLWEQAASLERLRTVMMFTRWPIAPFVYFMSGMTAITALILFAESIKEWRYFSKNTEESKI